MIISSWSELSSKRYCYLLLTTTQNAGHLLQNMRAPLYTSLTSVSDTTHLIVFSYRGFPRSTGSPSELGLITDGLSVVNFVLSDLNFPPSRIALIGQSLGTAVLSGVSSYLGTSPEELKDQSVKAIEDRVEGYFPDISRPVDFKTVILICSFFDLRSNLLTYKAGGVLPFLQPLSKFPKVQKFITSFTTDTWDSKSRLASLITSALREGNRHVNLQLVHAIDDADISFHQSEMIFDHVSAAGEIAAGSGGVYDKEGSTEIGHLQQSISWKDVKVDMRLVRIGGHNHVTVSTAVAAAIMRGLGLVQAQ
jgi:abhydrolase domain-containing protein 12